MGIISGTNSILSKVQVKSGKIQYRFPQSICLFMCVDEANMTIGVKINIRIDSHPITSRASA